MSELVPEAVQSDPDCRFRDSQLEGELAVLKILPVVTDQKAPVLPVQRP
jgi:hypothetical protein